MVNERWIRCGAWALALAYVGLLLEWSIRPEHFFFADDWDWLYRAALVPLREQFTILPHFAYNDRPVGALVFRALHGVFGLSPVPFHGFLLALHLLNMTLALMLARRLLQSWWVAAASALAYGGWSAAIEAASWMAAIFDVFGNTLVLLTILTFSSRRWPLRVASVALFYLALRTKESAIVTPVALVAIVLVSYPRKQWMTEVRRTLWPHFAVAAVFVAVYIPLLIRHQGGDESNSPYRMEFTARAFFEGLYDYTAMILYGRPWPVGRLVRWMGIALLLAGGAAGRSRATLAGLAGFVAFLLPVLFLVHQRQALYLYIPAVFFALALGGGAEWAAGHLRLSQRRREFVALAIILLCIVTLPHRAKMQNRADWLLAHTIRAKADIDAFRAGVPSLRNGARIALIGFPADYHVFQTRGCSVLKVYYRIDSVSCEPAKNASGADVAVVWRPEGIVAMAAGK
jgi:hypothetical protein